MRSKRGDSEKFRKQDCTSRTVLTVYSQWLYKSSCFAGAQIYIQTSMKPSCCTCYLFCVVIYQSRVMCCTCFFSSSSAFYPCVQAVLITFTALIVLSMLEIIGVRYILAGVLGDFLCCLWYLFYIHGLLQYVKRFICILVIFFLMFCAVTWNAAVYIFKFYSMCLRYCLHLLLIAWICFREVF